MDTYRIIIWLCFLMSGQISFAGSLNEIASDTHKAFKLQNTTPSNVLIDTSYEENTVITDFGGASLIDGMSISMEVRKKSQDFFVRLVLEDLSNNKYLLAESYNEISNGDTICFSDYGEETTLLDPLCPLKISIYIKNAVVYIHSLHLSIPVSRNIHDISLKKQLKLNLRERGFNKQVQLLII